MLSRLLRAVKKMRPRWKSQPMTRLEALRLVIANGQPDVPPATKYRVDQLNGSRAGANPPARRDPRRRDPRLRGDVA
jgi:hypothetical protein